MLSLTDSSFTESLRLNWLSSREAANKRVTGSGCSNFLSGRQEILAHLPPAAQPCGCRSLSCSSRSSYTLGSGLQTGSPGSPARSPLSGPRSRTSPVCKQTHTPGSFQHKTFGFIPWIYSAESCSMLFSKLRVHWDTVIWLFGCFGTLKSSCVTTRVFLVLKIKWYDN